MADMNGAAVFLTCENMECSSKKTKGLEQVNLWGEAKHDIHREDGRLYGTCTICKHERRYIDKQKLRYPMTNMSIGETFHSRSEERDFVKKNKLEAVN